MADLRPFRALRPRADLAAAVAAPPYDVVDTAEARTLAAGNPDSFLRVNRPEINLPDGVPTDSDAVHTAGRAALDDLIARGTLEPDAAPTYSVYRQRRGDHVQTGLVACAAAADYTSRLIKTHEQTRYDKETDRVRHIAALQAHDEPVFLLVAPGEPAWKPVADIMSRTVTRPPSIDITMSQPGTGEQVGHTLWRIDDPAEVAELTELLDAVPELFVADGHHRSAAAARLAATHPGAEAFLAVVFGGEELAILPYNRVVADLAGRTPEQWLADLAGIVEITPVTDAAAAAPTGRRELALYVAGRWYRLTLGEAAEALAGAERLADPVASLDVSLLQDLVLAPLLGITDPRSDTRVAFVGGVRGTDELERLVDSGRWAAAFALYPTSVAELVAVAGTGRDMPPKSTWFEPKLASGLVVHPFEG